MKNDYGLQLYSVRDVTATDMRGTLAKVSEIGYKYVEFAGFFDNSATDIRAMLDEYGLACSGTHSSLDGLRPTAIADTLKYHKELGNPNYIIPGADLSTLERIDDFCKVISFARPILEAEGIKLSYHNHSHEFVVMPWGSTIHSELERRTDIDFEIDTFWTFNAGVDSVQILNKLRDRISVIHIKDGFKGGKGMALGEGEAPVKAVIAEAEKLGFDMVVESETLSPSGIEEVTRCMNFLRSLEE